MDEDAGADLKRRAEVIDAEQRRLEVLNTPKTRERVEDVIAARGVARTPPIAGASEARALRAIRGCTDWLTAAEIGHVADLGADPTETVSRWKREGRTFALREGDEDVYPRYAFTPDWHPLPVIADILAVLAGYGPELLAAWFDSTSRFLGGRRPRELVATDSAAALAAAANMIAVQENQA